MCSEMDFTPEKSFSSNYKNFQLLPPYGQPERKISAFFYDFPLTPAKSRTSTVVCKSKSALKPKFLSKVLVSHSKGSVWK